MSIPQHHELWATDGVKVRGAQRLAMVLRDGRADVELFRTLATLVDTVNVGSVEEWKWQGPRDKFRDLASELGVPRLAERAESLRRLK